VRADDRIDRLTVRSIRPDPRDAALLADAHALGVTGLCSVEVADLLVVRGGLAPGDRERLEALLVDPLLQEGTWEVPDPGDGVAVETRWLPGVTDPVASALERAAATLGIPVAGAASGRRVTLHGRLDEQELHLLVTRLLANPVVERTSIGPAGFDDPAPGSASRAGIVRVRGLDDRALSDLDRDRGLALDPDELRAIAAHFHELGRDPTDVELETLAQTWSEHCAHKTFRARLTVDGHEVAPLLAQLRRATDAVAAPFVRSAFVGNAGIVSFHPGTTVAVKAETHNHPSAIEPFGGANTGVGGVIRDVMGAAHHPIAVTDVLCFGPLDTDPATLPPGVLHPRLVTSGVVAGVADYGNKIGLPTVAGAVLHDAGFVANPLVFCGCVGIAAERPPLTGPHPGDHVVVLGGRTGRDGLRGATFSSATMDATTGEVAGASVQIGDPITQKLLVDLLADLAATPDAFSAITDCGAGGLSSAVGEMAEHVGADVDLAHAPLKYPGLAPWEIWLSEAQERMVVAVPPVQLDHVRERAAHHGVELAVLGTFGAGGVLRVRHHGEVVLELGCGFLHDGRPQRSMVATAPSPSRVARSVLVPDPAAALLALLAQPDIASKEGIVRRFDHEIRGATVVRPLVGVRADAPADGVVLAEPGDDHGLAIGIGVNPRFGERDPERMAWAVVDEAIRNVVAVGADPDRVALMDNFSWGDPRRPSTLGELAAAVEGCCAASIAHGAPFVSGKDSLNNEYLATDGTRRSVPPTLVVTAVAHVPDVERVITPELTQAGHLVVLLGRTSPELGGSHLALVHPDVALADAAVPAPDPAAPARYRGLHRAISQGLVRSCHDVSEGGLAVALAEVALAGDLGIEVTALPHEDLAVALFAESTGRFVVEVAPEDLDALAAAVGEEPLVLGPVVAARELRIATPAGPVVVHLDDARAAFAGGAA